MSGFRLKYLGVMLVIAALSFAPAKADDAADAKAVKDALYEWRAFYLDRQIDTDICARKRSVDMYPRPFHIGAVKLRF